MPPSSAAPASTSRTLRARYDNPQQPARPRKHLYNPPQPQRCQLCLDLTANTSSPSWALCLPGAPALVELLTGQRMPSISASAS